MPRKAVCYQRRFVRVAPPPPARRAEVKAHNRRLFSPPSSQLASESCRSRSLTAFLGVPFTDCASSTSTAEVRWRLLKRKPKQLGLLLGGRVHPLADHVWRHQSFCDSLSLLLAAAGKPHLVAAFGNEGVSWCNILFITEWLAGRTARGRNWSIFVFMAFCFSAWVELLS